MGKNGHADGHLIWTNERRKLSDLIPWPRNPRQIKKDQAERLANSFDEFGQVETLAIGPIDESGKHPIYNGHQRLNVLAAENGPDYEVDVRVASRPLTEKEREKLVVYLHKGAAGEWDFDTLANEFEFDDLVAWGFSEKELLGLDFGNEVPDDPGAQIDRAQELLEKWQVKTGDLFEIGAHWLICGDCTDPAVVERVMGGEKAGAVYTDPPYGYDKGIEGDEGVDDALAVYFPAMKIAPVEQDAWAIVDTPKKYISEFIDASEAAGWNTREPVLMMYRNSMANGVYGTNIFELSFVYSKGSPKVNHRHLNGVDLARKGGHDNLHPTQKFLEAYEHFIELFAYPDAIVYDPFCGSGTTLVACERLGRRGRGVEIWPAYCAVTLERLSQMGLSPRLAEQVDSSIDVKSDR